LESAHKENVNTTEGREKVIKSYSRAVAFTQKQFREEILPRYRKVKTLFEDHRALVKPSTNDYYAPLVGFLHVWEYLKTNAVHTINNSVINKMGEVRIVFFIVWESDCGNRVESR